MGYLVKKIIGLAICLAVLIVGYNYFWGTPEEQESSKEILGRVKDLTGSVVELLSSEKEKFDKGKYDDALVKVKATFAALKEKAAAMGDSGQELMDRIGELEQQESELSTRLAEQDSGHPAKGMMMVAPGSDGDEQAAAPEDAGQNNSEAEELRQQILKLNEEARQLGEQFQ